MGDDVVIRAEGLGKKYLIGHAAHERERYVALRDVLARGAHSARRKALDLLRGRALVGGDTVEEFWALRDVSFEVKRGEVLGIIGRNGAGKSTLLKILSRITEPTAGRVTIKGRVASLLEVGTGFHPELTGRENIYLNGAILGMTRGEIRRKFDEIVAFAEVEKFLDTPVKRYSSGMYVRLAFAVAAHLEPEILAVDEVLAVGDAAFQKKCLGKMGDVAGAGRTLLFVSHNMNAIERLCDRVIVLHAGGVVGAHCVPRDAINAYFSESAGEGGGASWQNAGNECPNDYFVPQNFAVHSAAPESNGSEPLSNRFPIEIVLSGNVLCADPALNIGIGVYDDRGNLLFWSFTTDGCEERWPCLEPGPLRLRVRLPARLLNEGDYRVELLASLHQRAWLLQPGGAGPSLRFTIRGGLSDSPLWDHRRNGILAPVLDWERAEVEPA